jgi:cell division septation protein DedD
MQKTIAIVATLLLGIFIGVFSVSALNKKVKHKSETQAETNAENSAIKSKGSEDQAVFYTSVGGSSPSSDNAPSSGRVATRYTIELGTVNSQADAESLLLKLKDRGIDGFYTPMRRGGRVIFHVRIGLFASADDAEQNLKKIAARANVKGRVTRLH